MARTADGRPALVELKAVDGAYPLYGAVTLDPDMPLDRGAGTARRRVRRARSIRRCLRGSISSPARGSPSARRTIEIAAVLKNEPDKLAGGIGFGPRVIISEAALRATGLVQPGSLVRWHYRVRRAGRQRPRRGRARRRRPRSNCRMPAGRCAPAPTPRPRWSATSSASRNSSRWSA